MLRGTDYEVYAAIQEPLKQGDSFYNDYMSYYRIKTMTSYAYPLLIASIILLLISASYLSYTAGRREKGGEIALLPIDRLYTYVHT